MLLIEFLQPISAVSNLQTIAVGLELLQSSRRKALQINYGYQRRIKVRLGKT